MIVWTFAHTVIEEANYVPLKSGHVLIFFKEETHDAARLKQPNTFTKVDEKAIVRNQYKPFPPSAQDTKWALS